jgi:hypothetical protein
MVHLEAADRVLQYVRATYDQGIEIPIDSGIGLSITIDKLRVFINKTLSTESLINQLLIKRVGLSISIDSRKRVFFLYFLCFFEDFFS